MYGVNNQGSFVGHRGDYGIILWIIHVHCILKSTVKDNAYPLWILCDILLVLREAWAKRLMCCDSLFSSFLMGMTDCQIIIVTILASRRIYGYQNSITLVAD